MDQAVAGRPGRFGRAGLEIRQGLQRLRAGGVEPVWRYALNARPVREHRQRSQPLGVEGQRIVQDLNRQGVAVTSLSALTGDATLLDRLRSEVRELEQQRVATVEARRHRLAEGDLGTLEKSFVVELLDHDRPVVQPAGLLARLAISPDIKGPVDAYYRMQTRVVDLNVWRTLPSANPPRLSQLWHRDAPEDYLIVKVFIYLEDVEQGSGPLTYALGTHGKGERRLRPRASYDGWNYRVDDEQMAAATGRDRLRTFTGAAGMVVFADTIGFHKGGFATSSQRLVVQTLYGSRAVGRRRMLGLPPGADPSTLPAELSFDLRAAR